VTYEPPEPSKPKASNSPAAEPKTVPIIRSVEPELQTFQDLANRYYSAHLLVTYFMHLDGDGSGLRLKKYFDAIHEERKKWAHFWPQYESFKTQIIAAQKEYETAFETFKKQPGVIDLGNGMVRYPPDLEMPEPKLPPLPTPPDNVDPRKVCARHIGILLGGRTFEQLEAEVRAAYQKVGLKL
jgi:hypothetical protein